MSTPRSCPDSGRTSLSLRRGVRIAVSVAVALAVATALFGGYHRSPKATSASGNRSAR